MTFEAHCDVEWRARAMPPPGRFAKLRMAGALLNQGDMANDKMVGMNTELVESYQKIVASQWEQFTAAKAARLQVVAGSKARISPPVPAPLLAGDSDELIPA